VLREVARNGNLESGALVGGNVLFAGHGVLTLYGQTGRRADGQTGMGVRIMS
jgi:hypothetical protein